MKISGGVEQVGRYEFLDGLRGVAAVSVVVGHLSATYYGASLAPNSWLAVPFFFILSAFVLQFAYAHKLNGGMTPLAFMTQRLVRLFPLILFAATISAVYVVWQVASGLMSPPSAIVSLATSVTTFPDLTGLGGGRRWPLNQPLWSLFWELIGSVVFAWAIFRLSSRLLLVVALFAIVAIAISGAAGDRLTQPLSGQALLAAFGFAIGPVLFNCRRREFNSALGWVSAVVFCIILVAPSLGRLGNLFTLAVIAPSVIFFGSYVQAKGALAQKIYGWLGEISYPLYVLHWPIMLAVDATLPNVASDLKFTVGLLLSLVVALLASRYVDIRARRALRRSPRVAWAFSKSAHTVV